MFKFGRAEYFEVNDPVVRAAPSVSFQDQAGHVGVYAQGQQPTRQPMPTDSGVQRISGPAVTKPAELEVELASTAQVIIPDRLAEQLPELLAALPHRAAHPTAAAFVAAADLEAEPDPVVPLYLRRPDAVPPKQQQLSAAIPKVEL